MNLTQTWYLGKPRCGDANFEVETEFPAYSTTVRKS